MSAATLRLVACSWRFSAVKNLIVDRQVQSVARIETMVTVKSARLPGQYAFVALAIVAALFAIPVRCDAISMPHSLFLTPGAIAASDKHAHVVRPIRSSEHEAHSTAEHNAPEHSGDTDAHSLNQIGSSVDAPVQVTQPLESFLALDEQRIMRTPAGNELPPRGRATTPDIPPPQIT